MAWVDQRDVAKEHITGAAEAIERARADGTSGDVIAALEELTAATIALASLAGASFDEK